MALTSRRTNFTPPPGLLEQQLVPVVTVLLGSLISLAPYIATAPVVPPLGFMMLLSWRLLRNDLWPVWAALPLGFFDDLYSGNPLGSGMALWTITFIGIDVIDRRFVWRDHKQDWAIAIAATASYLCGMAVLASLSGGQTPLGLLLPQIIFAALLFPFLSRVVAMLDRRRLGR